MILEKHALTLAEVNRMVKDLDDKEQLQLYLKTFTKLSVDKAKKLTEELRELNNMKMRNEHVIKIVDFLPRDAEELHKIFHESPLSDDEAKAILSCVEKY